MNSHIIRSFIALLTNNTGFEQGFSNSGMIGRTRHVTSPIWRRIDWLAGQKILIVGLSFTEFEMNKTVHLKLY